MKTETKERVRTGGKGERGGRRDNRKGMYVTRGAGGRCLSVLAGWPYVRHFVYRPLLLLLSYNGMTERRPAYQLPGI